VITNNATGKGGPRLEGRYGAESCCLQGGCAVVIAAVNCRWVMAAIQAAISAIARPTTRSGASRFSGFSSDHAVGAEALRILKPLGIDAAVTALKVETGETSAALRQLALALQQARYEATHARRQYDAVDPWSEAGTRRCRSCTRSKEGSPCSRQRSHRHWMSTARSGCKGE
jgi:hypothetical protein